MKDGGPAFATPPTTVTRWDCGDEYQETQNGQAGMSLRDWFASQALAGMCHCGATSTENSASHLARAAYAVADALLAEREKAK